MARINSLLLFVVALICAHSCSANPSTPNNRHNNNQDPCLDSTRPQYYNQVIPQREVVFNSSQLVMSSTGSVEVTDTTGCVLVRLSLNAYQSGKPQVNPSFSATMDGTLFDLCGDQTYYFQVAQQDGRLLSVPSIEVQSAILEPLTLTGSYYNDTFTEGLTITTDRAYFYATTQPRRKIQDDELNADTKSQCTARRRYDDAANVVYSQPFQLTATLGNGQVYTFAVPADVTATALYYHFQFFYEQCTCASAASQVPSTPSANPDFTV